MVNRLSLDTPLTEAGARALRAGDMVFISGLIVTGRDRVHKYLVEHHPVREELPADLAGSVLYHCGPVTVEEDGVYRTLAAGPTTSARMEMYEPEVIGRYGIRGIMGKGGMGPRTLQALKDCGCVYLNTVGGGAVYLAERVVRTAGVWRLDEFGAAEAMWVLQVKDFPAMVTMDSLGNNIHGEIERLSAGHFAALTGVGR
jgi:fumarate hydratase class I